jgi:lipoprotein-anchoring transpeptidase ErfK/SrfK
VLEKNATEKIRLHLEGGSSTFPICMIQASINHLIGSPIFRVSLLVAASLITGCAATPRQQVLISAADQRMILLEQNNPITSYPISTSKFGLSDKPGSYGTPIGRMRIKEKIGRGMPAGAVFKSRIPTGEVLPVDAPGRDPIVTRILWLEGLERGNRNAFRRYIYIHGTPEERNIGLPVSYGCIRMRSKDVIDLFDKVEKNTLVVVTSKPLPTRFAMGDKKKATH